MPKPNLCKFLVQYNITKCKIYICFHEHLYLALMWYNGLPKKQFYTYLASFHPCVHKYLFCARRSSSILHHPPQITYSFGLLLTFSLPCFHIKAPEFIDTSDQSRRCRANQLFYSTCKHVTQTRFWLYYARFGSFLKVHRLETVKISVRFNEDILSLDPKSFFFSVALVPYMWLTVKKLVFLRFLFLTLP